MTWPELQQFRTSPRPVSRKKCIRSPSTFVFPVRTCGIKGISSSSVFWRLTLDYLLKTSLVFISRLFLKPIYHACIHSHMGRPKSVALLSWHKWLPCWSASRRRGTHRMKIVPRTTTLLLLASVQPIIKMSWIVHTWTILILLLRFCFVSIPVLVLLLAVDPIA